MHELTSSFVTLLFLLAVFGLGCGVARAFAPFLPPGAGLFGRLVLGFGTALGLTFGLMAAGLFGWPATLLLAAMAAAGLWLDRAELLLAWRQPRFGKADLLPAALVLLVLLPSFWITLNPAVHWDSAVYHLALPRLYAEAGGFVPVEMSVYSIWPHGFQLLYAFGLLFGGPWLTKLLHFSCGLFLVAGLHHAFRRSELPAWRFGFWVAACGFLVHPVVLFELTVAYVDLAQAFFYLAAFLFLLRAREEGEPAAGSLLLAGIAAGGVAVCKPTGPLLLLPLGVILLPYLLAERRAERAGRALRLILGRFLLPILVLWLPWVLRSWRITGNPVYPFLWPTFGGPDWNNKLAEEFLTWQRGIGMGREPLDYLLLPWRVLTEGGRNYASFDGRLGLPLIALLLLALWRAARPSPPPLLRPALLVSALFFVLWSLSSQQMRFLIPLLPLLSLAGGLAAADLGARWLRFARFAPVLALLFPLVVFSQDPSLLRKGLQHWVIYRDTRFVPDPWGAAQPFRQPLLELPPDAKILMLNWNQGYYCPRPFLADSFFEASQIEAWLDGVPKEELPAKLEGRGVSHVLFHLPWRLQYTRPLRELLGDPTVLRPIWQSEDGSFLLFELRKQP